VSAGWVPIDEYFREAEASYLRRHGAPTKVEYEMLRADLYPTHSEPPDPEPEKRWQCWDKRCSRDFTTWDRMNRHYEAAHVRPRRREKLARAS
jgi:hypothetical protein